MENKVHEGVKVEFSTNILSMEIIPVGRMSVKAIIRNSGVYKKPFLLELYYQKSVTGELKSAVVFGDYKQKKQLQDKMTSAIYSVIADYLEQRLSSGDKLHEIMVSGDQHTDEKELQFICQQLKRGVKPLQSIKQLQ